MAQVIRGGRDAYRALRIGQDVTPLADEFRQRAELLRSSISSNDKLLAGFYDEVDSTFQAFNDIDYASIRKALLRQMDNVSADDRVRQLWTVEDFQAASGLERQLIMANPTIRNLAKKQRIEGYAECFEDPFKSLKDEEHPIYQRVMNGMLHEEGEFADMCVTYSCDDYGFELPELDVTEQVITLHNWSIGERLAKELTGQDFTSPSGATLG